MRVCNLFIVDHIVPCSASRHVTHGMQGLEGEGAKNRMNVTDRIC